MVVSTRRRRRSPTGRLRCKQFLSMFCLQLSDLVYRIPTLVSSLLLESTYRRLNPNSDKDAAIAGILEDDSPYPEVRSAVANTDDETIPVGTLRSWVLGIIWAIIIPVCIPSIEPHPLRLWLTSFGTGFEPILLFSVSFYHNSRDRCPAAHLSPWSSLGQIPT